MEGSGSIGAGEQESNTYDEEVSEDFGTGLLLNNVTITPNLSTEPHDSDAYGSGVKSPYALTEAQQVELTSIGVTVEDYEFFLRHFVGHRFDFLVKKSAEGDWSLIRKAPLNNALLVSHLLGRSWVATGCRWNTETKRHQTDYFVVDLDAGPTVEELTHRYSSICVAIGTPSLVFRSSSSGGLHAYYLLTEPVDLHRLRSPDGTTGVIVDRLRARGLKEEPGRVEVYPRGQYLTRGVQSRLRLPFGSESWMLDSEDLLPLGGSNGGRALQCARTLYADGKIPVVDVGELLPVNHKSPRPQKTARRAKTHPGSSTRSLTASQNGEAAILWREGLTCAGELNRAASALAFDLAWRATPMSDAQEQLVSWLEKHHNGCSRTYNRNPGRAAIEVSRVCERVYRRVKFSAGVPLPPLSVFEAQLVLNAFAEDAVDPRTGEVLSRYKAEFFAFELLRSAKQWVLANGARCWRSVEEYESGCVVGSLDFLQAVYRRIQRIWPAPQPIFIVPVPYALRIAMKGISEKAEWPLWRALQLTGMFALERGYNPWTHRSATYRVPLDFGAQSPTPDEFYTLQSAIKGLVPPRVIKARYSRHHAAQIASAVSPPPSANRHGEVDWLFARALRGHLESESLLSATEAMPVWAAQA